MRTSNELDNELVSGTSGADTIENSGQYATIQAGGGNDSIYNEGDNSFIDGEAGNDTIEADDNDYVTVNGGAGADEMNGVYYNSSINGGAGNDIVAVKIAEVSTVEGGDGNDEISGVFVGSEVNGGNGNDLITLQEGEENISQENTVKGGAGNDTIINEVTANYEDEEDVPGNVYQYAQGDGNDLISGITINDTLHITSGTISNVEIDDEDNAILTIGTGKITLEGAAGKTIWLQKGNGDAEEFTLDGEDTVESDYIELTNGNDTYSNLRDNVTIAALAGNDTIENSGANVSISGGEGADVIENTGEAATINGDAGNDIISNSGNEVYIDGGAGNDSISNEGEGVTITGGAGNDSVINNGSGLVYEYAGGKDIIEGYSEGDEIIIGADYEASISGNDWIIKVGSGSITLKDAASQTIVIDGEEIEPVPEIQLPEGWKYGTSSKTNTNTSIITATLATGAEDLDLTQDYGVKVEKVDASKITSGVAITGNDSGNSIKGSKGADTIYSGAGNDTVSLGAGANVADYYVYTGGDDIIYDYGTGNDTIQIIIEDMDDITMETVGANVSVQTAAGTIALQKATGKDIVLVDANGDIIEFNDGPTTITGTAKADVLTNSENGAVIDALAGNDKITNSGNDVSINAGAGNDSISNSGSNVTINAGKGNDSIYNEGAGNLYQYASGDGKDTIVGFSENDTLTITSGSYSYSVSGNDFVVKVGSGTITLKDAAGQIIYLNDEVIEPATIPDGWQYSNTKKTAIKATLASAENVDLNESYGEGVVFVDGSKITAGVKITGNAEGNSIKGGKGADTIIGGEGNDTVSLGGGADIFIYQGGDDIIQDYKAGDDTIKLIGNDQTVVSSSVKGSDVILYTASGSITVKKGNSQSQILVVNADGEQVYPELNPIPEGWKLDTNKKLLQASVKTAEAEINLTESYGEGVEKVDASKITDGVVVTGNDSDNSIKGTKGDDIIAGGDGNDTVSLGAGADIYIYSGGDDVIQDYVAGTDSIQIDTVNVEFDPKTGVTTEGTDLVITTGTGTVTIKKGKDKAVTIVDAEENIIYPLEADFPPEGWTLDSTKKKITASTSADNLDLSIDNSTAAGVEKVDASKTSGGVEIIAHDDGVSVKGGKGADTIFGGAGNDTVSLGAGADIFVYNGGDDVIQDYVAGTDSIQIDTSQINFDPATGVSTIGSNVVISTDDGNLTINRGSGKKITIIDENGTLIYPVETLPEGWKYDSTHKQIKANATASIEDLDLTEGYGAGVTVVDAASAKSGVEITGNDDNNSIRGSKYNDEIIGGSGNDTISLGGGADTYIYNGGDDILKDYAAADVIQINTKNINIEEYTASGTDFKIVTESGTLTITKGASKDITVVDQDGEQIYPVDTDTLPAGWKFDTAKTMITATLKAPENIDLTENYGANVKKVDASKTTSGVEIVGNNNDNSIKGGSGEDTIIGGTGNDTVSLGGGADVYIYQGGDDLIQDYANIDIVQADTGNIQFTAVETIGSNVVYTTDAGTLTFKGAKTKTITLLDEDGEEIVIGGSVNVPAGWSLDSNKNSMKATLKTAADIDLTESYGANVTKVDAASITGGVEIIGNGLSNSIKGGKGADTISGGDGNDTVSLGAGADVYVYSNGDDFIQDYATVDTIKFETEILSSSVSGSNVIISTEEGKVTVKGMKGKEISVIDSDGAEYTFTDTIDKNNSDTLPAGWKLDTAKKVLTASVASADNYVDLTASYGESVTKVDGSKITGGFEVVGNDLGISIKGGSGADTLAGGEGNDTLTGGNGNDLFIYNGGNDVITDYKAGQDAIQINTTNIDIIEKSTSGTNVIIETEAGNLTIKSGRGKEITLYDEDGEELFFDDDGSFVSANTIDEIFALTDDNYSQGKINLGSEADILNPAEKYIAAAYNQDEDK